MKSNDILKEVLRKSQAEIPDKNFEDRVMQKIEFAANLKKQRQHNLRLSWIFLLASSLLLGGILVLLTQVSAPTIFSNLGIHLAGSGQFLLPAISLVAAIIILVQVDNLFRLSYQFR